ncbi:MAG TPA: YdcF family protein [Burkholderiales bacterium]|nr:YdcF family protein [Burkholderiales bacterium]
MEWLITKAFSALLAPLGIVLVILLVAALVAWRRPLAAWRPVALALIVLYPLSTHFVADQLLWWLEPAPRDPAADKSGQAIVVLGGGTYFSAPEYGGDTVNSQVLARLRYAAHLYRALDKPVLASGGAPEGNPVPEARLMREVLQQDFRITVQWIEEGSRNTFENAQLSASLLKPASIQRIYLVTHAWHMRRARLAFEHAGFNVIPAPTGYATRFKLTALDFLPDARALYDSGLFFREATGIGWYYLRIAIGR